MMKTNCPRGGLLNPSVAGRLFVWLVHVRLFGFVLKEILDLSPCLSSSLFFSVFLVDTVLPDFSLVFPGMAQTVWLMDTMLVWLINQSMSWPACPVGVIQCVPWRNISVPPHACLFDFDAINLKPANTGSAVTPPSRGTPWTVSIETSPSWSPQSDLVRGEQGRLLHLSLPLKPQGLNRLSLREKNQSKRILRHKLLLTFISFSYVLHHWVF